MAPSHRGCFFRLPAAPRRRDSQRHRQARSVGRSEDKSRLGERYHVRKGRDSSLVFERPVGRTAGPAAGHQSGHHRSLRTGWHGPARESGPGYPGCGGRLARLAEHARARARTLSLQHRRRAPTPQRRNRSHDHAGKRQAAGAKPRRSGDDSRSFALVCGRGPAGLRPGRAAAGGREASLGAPVAGRRRRGHRPLELSAGPGRPQGRRGAGRRMSRWYSSPPAPRRFPA